MEKQKKCDEFRRNGSEHFPILYRDNFFRVFTKIFKIQSKKKCFVTENQLFNSNSGVLSLVSLTRIFIVKDKKDTGSIVGDL